MDNLTIRVNWRGPFSLEEVCETDLGGGLYLLTGKRPYERNEQIQYCGITEGFFRSRLKQHHKLPQIKKDLRIWLGQVVYPEQVTRTHLELAEAIIVYFWQPNLNERKRIQPPRPTVIISQWLRRDGSPRFNQLSIYSDLHDVICWDGVLWRTGNLKVYAG
ncbi:hypothetical protein GCM10027019_09290 [Melaminivora jejuensis]|uniref:hypothetical protein n=1 Tax=Melaminivora jejuensis TaxID=1267217 RepID=UPI001AE01161|nr:hypothetical protein [Melaminivora jejuensis]UHJ64258.1 hypothetical protein LVC68_12965 [Melaminivora jejuensis]